MSEIDDIFKNNLDSKGIDYSEAYWDEMEKLLDKEKRKKFFFRVGVLAFAILGLLIGSVLYFSMDRTQQKPMLTQIQQPSVAPQDKVSADKIGENGNVEAQIKENPSGNLKDGNQPVKEKLPERIPDNNPDLSAIDKIENHPLSAIPLVPKEIIVNSGVKNEMALAYIDERLSLMPLRPLRMEGTPFGNLTISYDPGFKRVGHEIVRTGQQEDSLKKLAKWQFYVATGYEYDRYTRAANVSLLKENERTLDRSGFNVNFIARKKNWGFKSGFGVLQLSELTNYITVNKSYAFDTSYRMINPNYEQTSRGSKIALIKREIDTSVTLSSSIDNPDSKVNFTYLKIPLMATYEFRMRRFSVYMDAGLNTALLIQKNGNYTSFENNRYVVKDVKDNNDLNKVLFQASATIGLKYSIGKSLNVFGGYGISRSLNSMVKSYDQKPKINLFTFGLEIKL